jgi:hypothetical protein
MCLPGIKRCFECYSTAYEIEPQHNKYSAENESGRSTGLTAQSADREWQSQILNSEAFNAYEF